MYAFANATNACGSDRRAIVHHRRISVFSSSDFPPPPPSRMSARICARKIDWLIDDAPRRLKKARTDLGVFLLPQHGLDVRCDHVELDGALVPTDAVRDPDLIVVVPGLVDDRA